MALFNSSIPKKLMDQLKLFAKKNDLKGPAAVIERLFNIAQFKGKRILNVTPQLLQRLEVYQIEKGLMSKEEAIDDLLTLNARSEEGDSLMTITMDWADE